MGKIIYFFAVFLFAILEKTVFNDFLVFGTKPDIVLLLVICQGLNNKSGRAALIGFASGIVKGLADPHLAGIYLLSYTLVGFAAGILAEKVYPDRIWVPLIFTFFISTVNVLLITWLLGVLNYIGAFSLYKNQLLASLYNTILICPVYWLYDYFIPHNKKSSVETYRRGSGLTPKSHER